MSGPHKSAFFLLQPPSYTHVGCLSPCPANPTHPQPEVSMACCHSPIHRSRCCNSGSNVPSQSGTSAWRLLLCNGGTIQELHRISRKTESNDDYGNFLRDKCCSFSCCRNIKYTYFWIYLFLSRRTSESFRETLVFGEEQ